MTQALAIAFARHLRKLSEHWQQIDFDALTDVEQRAFRRLVKLGYVQIRFNMEATVRSGEPAVFLIECTGDFSPVVIELVKRSVANWFGERPATVIQGTWDLARLTEVGADAAADAAPTSILAEGTCMALAGKVFEDAGVDGTAHLIRTNMPTIDPAADLEAKLQAMPPRVRKTAKYIIEHPGMTGEEIAAECGYSDPSSFRRDFGKKLKPLGFNNPPGGQGYFAPHKRH